MALPILPPPPAWELNIPPSSTAGLGLLDGSSLPLALFRPIAPLLGHADIFGRENFLSGLQAERVMGPASLPVAKLRRVPLIWMGVALRGAGRLFDSLREGCWVCGFPAVGRGRELLRLGDLANSSGLGAALDEMGQSTFAVGSQLYFNFHYDEPESACERVYVLDAGAGCLHGFAFPRSALAPAKMK